MEYKISKEEVKFMADAISTIAQPESVVSIAFGLKGSADKLACVLRCTTSSEQVQYKFAVPKAENWTEADRLAITVKAVKFASTLQAILPFNADVIIGNNEQGCFIGVPGKAILPLELLAEETPEFKGDKTLLQVQVATAAFTDFIRKGCSATAAKGDSRGCGSAVWQFNADTATLAGTSTDTLLMAAASMKVTMPSPKPGSKAEETLTAMKASLKAYTDANKGAAAWAVPAEGLKHMAAFVAGAENFILQLDEAHVAVNVSGRLQYTCVLGTMKPILPSMIGQYADAEGTTASGDSAELQKGIEFINKINAIDGDELKYPINLQAKGTAMQASSGAAGQIKTAIRLLSTDGDSAAYVAGVNARRAMAYLDKGNVTIKFCEHYLVLRNGSPEAGLGDAVVIVMLVNPPTTEDNEAKTE